MHPYKRTLVALTVAAALVSQSPAIVHADDGDYEYSDSHCYMSRMVNGTRWTSTDCREVHDQMTGEMEGLRNMFGRLAPLPVYVPVHVPEPANTPDPEPVSVHDIDTIMASIQQMLFRYIPWFWR